MRDEEAKRYLYEEIKNGGKKDHGICFVSPTDVSMDGRKDKFLNGDDASRSIANRLSTRNDNQIVLIPYNPGAHWVLGVLDMRTSTFYYLDSLRPSNIDPHLKHIIEVAIVLYNTQSGSKKRVNINWINVVCPMQPLLSIECGYYVMKFMKEVAYGGVDVLKNNFENGNDRYTDDDIDVLRE